MGVILFYLLLLIVVALAATAFYLLVRIIGIYRRARRLETMRSYETILYAALPKLSPEDALRSLLPEPDEAALEEVLLRMSDEAEGEWKEKVIQVYRTRGYAEKRLRQLRSRSRSRRSQAARRLGRIGDPEAVAPLKELLADPREEVREAALFALGRMGTLPALRPCARWWERVTAGRGRRWPRPWRRWVTNVTSSSASCCGTGTRRAVPSPPRWRARWEETRRRRCWRGRCAIQRSTCAPAPPLPWAG